ALGRIGTREAQGQLLALLPTLPPDDDARRQLVGLLRPSALDDEVAARLAAAAEGGKGRAGGKKQAPLTRGVGWVGGRGKLPDGAASPAARQLVERMTVLAQRGAE